MIRGLGGIFIYADDATAMVEWYTRHLGIKFDYEPEEKSYYRDFVLPLDPAYGREEREVFAIRQADESRVRAQGVVINLRVDNLTAMITDGLAVDRQQDYDYGRFALLRDPEGNLIELFQPA